MTARPCTVTMVVPRARVAGFANAGWAADGRSNAFTHTLSRRFASEAEAKRVAERAGCVYSIEVVR